jgi:hypothetical protein
MRMSATTATARVVPGWRRSQTRLVSGVGARFTAARCSLAPVTLLYSSPPDGYSRGYG